MANTSLYIGEVDEFIQDSKQARETIDRLVGEAVQWSDFIINAGGRLKGALENLRSFVIGESHPGDPNNVAIIYRETGAGGASRGLNAGDYLRNFRDFHHKCGRTWAGTTIWCQWNDRVNAINVQEGYFVACYKNGNFGGERLIITGPARLHDLPSIGWGDCISSAMVYTIDQIHRAY
jgi:hypothetical protein